MAKLSISGLAYTLGGQTLFKNLNLTLDHGMTAGVIGPSGVGKTSLLYLIAGLAKPSTGTIRADDEILTGEGIFVPPEKRRIGMVFQDYAVFPHMTVEKNLLFGMKYVPRHEHHPRLNEMLEVMRLTNLRGRYPHELSGGQQQRVAIARTLLSDARIILFDEPFCNLEQELSQQIARDIMKYLQTYKTTALLVSHNMADINLMCQRIYCLCEMGMLPFEPLPSSVARSPVDISLAATM